MYCSVHLVSTLATNYPVKKWTLYQKASGNLNGNHLPLTCQIADGKERVKIFLMYVFFNLFLRIIWMQSLSPNLVVTSSTKVFFILQGIQSDATYGLKPKLYKHWLQLYKKSGGKDLDSSKRRKFFSICKY